MSSENLDRVSARTAAEVCSRFESGGEARELLRGDMSPRQYLDLLTEKQHYQEAVRFLAHALPKQEAVWWACLCAREAAGSAPAQQASAALEAAEKWVRNPTEENRRPAMPAAEAAGLATPAGSAALAAFLSGGSLGPSHVPAVPPPENVAAQAVAGAVILSVVSRELEKLQERFQAALARGREVGHGTNRWDSRR